MSTTERSTSINEPKASGVSNAILLSAHAITSLPLASNYGYLKRLPLLVSCFSVFAIHFVPKSENMIS